MDLNLVLAIIGTSVTVLSLIYALLEGRARRSLEDYNREQAWEILRQCSIVVWHFQQALKADSPEKCLQNIAVGEREAQELVVNSVRMIKRFEKKFDEQIIEEWAKKGKLPNETFIEPFKKQIH